MPGYSVSLMRQKILKSEQMQEKPVSPPLTQLIVKKLIFTALALQTPEKNLVTIPSVLGWQQLSNFLRGKRYQFLQKNKK